MSALVRPLLWLAVFAAGFRNVFGVAIVEPYDTYIPYDVYIAPGLVGMVLLFNGMQSSLAMVYDREMGLMRLLLTAPLPRSWLLFCKLCATALLSVLQALAFVALAALLGTALPVLSLQGLHALAGAGVRRADAGRARACCCRCTSSQLENFAGTMNFVIFPMYFLSTALYPLWKLQESGARMGVPGCARESLHARGGVDPLRAVRQGSGHRAMGRDRLPARVLRCSPAAATTRSAAWAARPSAGAGA